VAKLFQAAQRTASACLSRLRWRRSAQIQTGIGSGLEQEEKIIGGKWTNRKMVRFHQIMLHKLFKIRYKL
jgi:hypothetical protein